MKKVLAILVLLAYALGITVYANTNIPILLYHNLAEEYDEDQSIVTISPAEFESHILYLLEKGFTPITFEQYYDAAKNNGNLPENPIIITFDDGYTSNYTYAYPVLKKYNIPATIFIVADSVGMTPSLYEHFSWEQALEMQRSGLISIQSHTFSHVDLLGLDEYNLEREIRYSKYVIEKNLGTKCNVISFPYGFHNSEIISKIHTAGYDMAVQVGNFGTNTVSDAGKALIRITVYGSWTPEMLVSNIKTYSV